ncbi:MAG: GNAT family N-acetyltransferase [Butyrivibrio sp.]|nr:GNAT family N-acetyltransferase [Butyrivibrio sp.]
MTEDKIVVRGNKISLRFITHEDTKDIVRWRNNKRVRDNFVFREHFTEEIHEKWLRDKVEAGDVVQFIICENERDCRPVGSVYFRDIDREKRCAEYGVFIGEDDAIGRGYGNEVVVLALKYADEELGLEKVILRAFTRNAPAVRSYSNAGFVKASDLPGVLCSDGEREDMILMERHFERNQRDD